MPSFSNKLIDFSDTNSFTNLILDYLSSSGQLQKFSSFIFNEAGFSAAILQRKKETVNRQLLLEVIREQYQKSPGKLSVSPEVEQNITSLDKLNTFTVTTGHQLNIFTGPVYFIYKIVSTIHLAAQLQEKFPDYNFVPVYWMASEDHDLEEINHIHLFGKKITWTPATQGAAGRIKCNGISEAIETLRNILGDNANTKKIMSLFSTAYDENNNLSEATRILVHELFSRYGLVTLNADDARLKKLFVYEMKDDALNHTAFNLVGETIAELEKDYKPQVNPREINLFYLRENSRERIVEEGGSYSVLNSDLKFSQEQLLAEIESCPEKFSPNVVLRPLYQEKILPNIAYVGGPAEVSYWLEYRKMFEHYGAVLPVLVLRSCAMIVDAASRDRMKKLGLEPADLFMREEDLVNKYLKLKSSKEFSMQSLMSRTEELFNETSVSMNELDPTLLASVEAEKQKMINGLKMLEERIRRAEKKKHETEINQVRKLKEKFFPENKLQERHENLLTFISKYGNDFPEVLVRELDPWEKKFVLLVEE